jgi:hypothetical protein
MLDPAPASLSPICRCLRALGCLSMLGLGATPASALPPLEPGPAPGLLRVQGEPPGSEQRAQENRQEPFDTLNQVLEDNRAKLEALAEATARLAADTELRGKLQALKRENERSAAELAEANTRRLELERSSELAEARIAELTQTVERLKTEQTAAREQLGQAAGAAVEAERAREAMSNEVASLRGEAARARDGLRAANTEIARLKTTNAELEKEVASWRTSSTSAIETARQNSIMMEERIEELNAALALGRPAEAASAPDPQAKPAPVEDERATPARSHSAMAQPSAREPAGKTGAGQSADSPIERSETELSMAEPTAAPAQADSRLAGFHASIEALNDLEVETEGVNLFSGIASVDGRTVHVGATGAWDSLPAVGKESYLGSLLDLWVAAQGGQGPAVVRIVDPSGRVLAEKSEP